METILGAIAQSTGEAASFCTAEDRFSRNFSTRHFSDFSDPIGASAGGLRAFVK
jgi:hypothetical protein